MKISTIKKSLLAASLVTVCSYSSAGIFDGIGSSEPGTSAEANSTNLNSNANLNGNSNNNANKNTSSSLSGALSGTVSTIDNKTSNKVSSVSEGSQAGVSIAPITTTSDGGDSVASSYSSGGKGEGGDGFGGDVGDIVTTTTINDTREYPTIPVNSVWTVPAVCTSSQAASALKISVSQSETDSLCMRLTVAQTQWSMANQCGPQCDDQKTAAMATISEISTSLADQAGGDQVYKQTKRWGGLIGFFVTVLSIL